MITGLGGISPTSVAGNPGTGSAATSAGANPADSFATLLSRAAGETVETLQAAEQASVSALQGKADIREVVDAVMSAEQSLQAAIAIRDKIVTAYLEVSRMAI
jgi:flagellar hook-basal body complex protein FliE